MVRPRGGKPRACARLGQPLQPHLAAGRRSLISSPSGVEGQAMAERRRLGIAVVGSGRIGTIRTRQALEHPAVEFVAVSDAKAENAKKLAEASGAHLYSADNREIIEHPDVDTVIVSTSEGEHTQPVLQAIAAGKSVLIEKPIA